MIYIHIVFGFLALILAPAALIVKKGGKKHRQYGKGFYWSMAIVCLSAILLAFIKFNPFLLMIAVLSFYSAFSGYRAIKLSKVKLEDKILWQDWSGMILNGLCNLGFIIWGGYQANLGEWDFFPYLATGFGLIGLNLSYSNWMKLKKPGDKQTWLIHHIGSMVGAYIATLTAFSVTTLTFISPVVSWIWPTLLGVPVIVYYSRKQRKLVSNQ